MIDCKPQNASHLEPRQGLTTGIPNTLHLGNVSLLKITEELSYKIYIAHDILVTCQAEARVVEKHLVLADDEVEIHEAEAILAASRAREARRRKEYFRRMTEGALDDITDAEMQAALLRLEGKKAGIELAEESLRVQDPDRTAIASATLD
ncbi:hypothetical protein MVEN_00092900 [Mycena venus]|uniref:Uncharacterized protein n=1 Tax=Mycena venus TaxID=2733690 RepID=A0A8H7DGJ5_9AGAR|nr:hypothetical protein MVEN_00092900 [Mycena venus]